MAHEIETFNDGTTAFFTARTDAWHQLGTVTRDCLTAEQVMTTAHLGGWNVHTVPLTATDITENGVTTIPVADHYATVRTHPATGKPDVLGVVGGNYTVVQNEQHCELLNLLVDEAGAHFETAGSLRGGREVFVTMKLPNTLTLAGNDGQDDDIELYLAAMSSHDGTTAWRVIVTPVRIVCANTQRLALRDAKATYAIRHTRSASGKIAQARQALGLVWNYCDAFQTAAQNLINQSLELDTFQQIVDKIWPVDPNPGPRAVTLRDRRNTTLRGLFSEADTQHNVRGTRWAGLQAITEYLDHHTPAPSDDVRAARVLTSHAVADRKQQAFQLLTTV